MSILPAPVPGLFERQSINLIIGTSGASKTHFLLNQLENYGTGGGFLNYAAGPQGPEQLGMIIASRTQRRIENMLVKFPFLSEHLNFPLTMWQPEGSKSDYDNLCLAHDQLNKFIPSERRPVRVLVVKGFQNLMASGKILEINPVREFCKGVQLFCAERNVMIIGTTGTIKMKGSECYPQLADRIPGTGIWASEMDSLLGVERTKLHRPAELRPSLRKILVQVPDSVDTVHWGKFVEDGRLDVSPDYIPVDDTSATDLFFQEKLDRVKPGADFKARDLARWAAEYKVDPKTATRWANKMIAQGLLKREGHANRTRYIKPLPQ